LAVLDASLMLGLWVSPGAAFEYASPPGGGQPVPTESLVVQAAVSSDESSDEPPAGCSSNCPPISGRETLLGKTCFDPCVEDALKRIGDNYVPVGFGAWHWFQVDASGRGDSGYGCKGCRGTYFYYLTVDPELDLGGGRAIGGHLEYEFRDGDPLRTFYSRLAWSYEAYGYYRSKGFGTLKAGQVLNRFALVWHGGFWTSVSGFDGFERDPDYGLSWEKTIEHDKWFTTDCFAQFFFHEDGVNNSFAGGDSESFVGVHERNTGVVRFVPTWKSWDEKATLAVGLAAMAGQIESRLPDFADDVTSGCALDVTYTRDRWKLFAEVVQVFGRRSPVRYVSGGPSNRLTDFFFGAEYTLEPVLLRANYELGLDANPHGRHELFRAGGSVRLTEHADLLVEYINQHVYGHATLGDLQFTNAIELILFWHY
jgi:hypothetical protein